MPACMMQCWLCGCADFPSTINGEDFILRTIDRSANLVNNGTGGVVYAGNITSAADHPTTSCHQRCARQSHCSCTWPQCKQGCPLLYARPSDASMRPFVSARTRSFPEWDFGVSRHNARILRRWSVQDLASAAASAAASGARVAAETEQEEHVICSDTVALHQHRRQDTGSTCTIGKGMKAGSI